VFVANLNNEFIQSKVAEYIKLLQPFLKPPQDDLSDPEAEELEHYMRYASLDAIEVILSKKQFQSAAVPLVPSLVPSLSSLIKSCGEELKNIDELSQKLIGASISHQSDEEPPALIDVQQKGADVPTPVPTSLVQSEPSTSKPEDPKPAILPFNFGAGGALPTFDFKFDLGAPTPSATPAATPAAIPAVTPAAATSAPAPSPLPTFNFGANASALPKFDFGGSSSGAAPSATFSFTPVAGGTGLDFPKFDFAAAAAEAAKAPGSGEKQARGRGRGRGRGGRGRGRAGQSSSEEESEEDIPIRGRGGRGRGRGRGRGLVHSDSEDDDFDSVSEESIDFDNDDDDGEEESPEAITCLASVDVALSVLQLSTPEQRQQLTELADQVEGALNILNDCTGLRSNVRERQTKLAQLRK